MSQRPCILYSLSLGSTPPLPTQSPYHSAPNFNMIYLALFTCQLHDGMESMLNNISGTNE